MPIGKQKTDPYRSLPQKACIPHIYLKDKKEGNGSGEKGVTEAINPAELKIEVIR